MISKENGFDLDVRWRFPGNREYAFAVIALFVFLLIIYANSFRGQWVFDDSYNIIENSNIYLKTLDWPEIKKTFYGPEGKKVSRPLAYFSFALNYYINGLNVFGYHIVNFIIHYLTSIFLFLFIYNTLRLSTIRDRYGQASYSIALLATFFWASSPLQVTAVTYIVQRMASMAGMFYIMAMYFYLKGRTVDRPWKRVLFWGFCALSAVFSFSAKENAVMLPVSIWLYDLLLIQGASRENIVKNLKLLAPVVLVFAAVGLWFVDISSIMSGAAYSNRPFTLTERLLTQPRIIVFYMTLLLYPLGSRLTLSHDIELSKSLLTPWSTLPAIAVITMLLVLAGYIVRKRPLISFCFFFYFINHLVESSFIPLELIYEHRNYIPSMFFFVPVAIVMIRVIDYFSYKKAIQFIMAAVFTFLLFEQGHTVFARNALFVNPLLLWADNMEKAPNLSRPYKNLGAEYGRLGFHEKAYELNSRALALDTYTNLLNRGITLHNLGSYHIQVTGDYNRALDYFRSAKDAWPDYWPTQHGIALCFIHKGDMAEAEKRLVTALSMWPDNAHLHHALGFVWLNLGKFDQAIQEAQKALSLSPDMFNALCVLGESSRRKGKIRSASFYWEEYIKNHSNNLQGNFALIELYARQNKKDDLARTIGRLIILKGSKNWQELIDKYLRDTKLAAYSPNPEEMLSIIRSNLDEQFHR